MKTAYIGCGVLAAIIGSAALADHQPPVPDAVISAQRSALAMETEGKGFGPQSPRDIDQHEGRNPHLFAYAPDVSEMTLCDIHLHESAEHKGGEFTTYAGNGDGEGDETGFKYNGKLTPAELTPIDHEIGESENGDLEPGDTIEVHFVYSTAQATLGHGLDTCFTDATRNPQLRVEAVVGVLVNDPKAVDFTRMAEIANVNDLNQLPNLPGDLGTPVVYDGSTTGPDFDEKGSPVQVTWSVRPKVAKIDANSVGAWFDKNPFEEDHAHGVRNLVINPDLLSKID